ncbi:ferroptosis suppressor protein 1-like [Amphiura filiformis]|uniref:ferroptosis suppressor protein 1-like n=1 Tax=Amphiura filiformis TaxID=82378 RepID=UPI003B20EAA3
MAHLFRALMSGTFNTFSVVAYCASPEGTKTFATKHVVIVGGGYAGIALANGLKGKCQFTLIDPKECFHHNLGALRACVEKGYAANTFIPYKPTYGDHFKQGTVIKTDAASKKVVLEGGEEVPYDYLVLATGTTGYFPGKLDLVIHKDVPRTIKMYDNVVDKIQAARDIVIIGGGPAGIELSGEIVADMKGKKVTLIHSRTGLINNAPSLTDKFRKSLHDKLVQYGVNVLMDQRVTNLNEIENGELRQCRVKTDKGNTVTADLVFVCTGMKTNTSAYSSTFADKMDNIGCLKVDKNLRVCGTTDVYAIGDCSTADEQAKMAFKAGMHAKLVADNIQADVEGKALKPYKPMGVMMCVPIGRNAGVTQMKTWVVGDFISRKLKGQGLFTQRYWASMKQTMPK